MGVRFCAPLNRIEFPPFFFAAQKVACGWLGRSAGVGQGPKDPPPLPGCLSNGLIGWDCEAGWGRGMV